MVEFALQQTVEAIIDACDVTGPIKLEVRYDEFVIDAIVTYVGAPLEFPTQPISTEEVLVRRHADRMASAKSGEQTVVRLHAFRRRASRPAG